MSYRNLLFPLDREIKGTGAYRNRTLMGTVGHYLFSTPVIGLLAGLTVLSAIVGIGACNRGYKSDVREPAPAVRKSDRIIVSPPAEVRPPEPTNAVEYGISKGLVADYLEDLFFDNNARGFIDYLSSLPPQMSGIAERSGLIQDVVDDKRVTSDELGYSQRLIGSYMKEIERMKPWLNQLSEQERVEALATNLKNFRETDRKGELFNSLNSSNLPPLIVDGIFKVDTVERKYAAEILEPEKWERGESGIKPFAEAAVKNIKQNFWRTHDQAWYIAHHPDYVTQWFLQSFPNEYKERAPPSTSQVLIGEVRSLGYTSKDKGQNTVEDIRLLLEKGSPTVQAWLRLYAWNLISGGGNKSSARQARVELTISDASSIGVSDLYKVVGPDSHDVPVGPVEPKDVELLRSRSKEPLLLFKSPYSGKPTIAVGWTRKSELEPDTEFISSAGPIVNRFILRDLSD